MNVDAGLDMNQLAAFWMNLVRLTVTQQLDPALIADHSTLFALLLVHTHRNEGDGVHQFVDLGHHFRFVQQALLQLPVLGILRVVVVLQGGIVVL